MRLTMMFLAFVKPAFFAPEPAFPLGWRRRQVQEGYEANDAGDHTLQGEEPAPAREAAVAAQMEDAKGEEGRDDKSELVSGPEETQANGQLDAGVKVAEVQDIIGDEAPFQHA